jgi:hypothetical protein
LSAYNGVKASGGTSHGLSCAQVGGGHLDHRHGAGLIDSRPRTQLRKRVKAQEAIERVYYAHQIGATKPFEDVVTRSLLEAKVTNYLKQSAALSRTRPTLVTASVLRERD